jgi:hypothetical protein
MATTPRGDNSALRAAVVMDMARRVAHTRAQRVKTAGKTGITPTPRQLVVRPMPLHQGQPAR